MARGPSPQWAPDPSGRHELRYWSGSAWTHYVHDDGTTGIDPPRSVPVPASGRQLIRSGPERAADPASADRLWRRNAEVIIVGCLAVIVIAVILNSSTDDSLARRSSDAVTSPTAADRAFAAVPSEGVPSEGASDTPSEGVPSEGASETPSAVVSYTPPDATIAAAPSLSVRAPRQVEETPSFLPPTAVPTPTDLPAPADLFTPSDVPTPTVTVFRTVTVTRTSTPPAAGGPADLAFADCDAMHERYPHGVGRPGAVDHTGGTPVTAFEPSDALYSANIKSDADKDGIACEKR